MNETHGNKPPSRTWLERIKQAFIREPHDRNELMDILQEAKERELIDADALVMIEGVLDVSEMRARDVMVPRSQMVTIEHDSSLEKILPIVIESAHSRFPVIGENRDEIIGILLAKDLLLYTSEHKTPSSTVFNLRSILRAPVFVPESKRLDVLLREFRGMRNHMALVVDEYGGIGGLITIEDVLEQIVGEIEDEHDTGEEPPIKKHSDSKYIIKALTPIEEFNEFFQENFSDTEYDTIGGYVMGAFGYLPKRGESIKVRKYRFKVLHADKRRIRVLQMTLVGKN